MKNYTFADVLIKPKYSEVLSRSNVNISTIIGSTNVGKIKLQLPIISSNMKTITGPKMTVAMAEKGAVGALHRFNTIDQAVDDYQAFFELLPNMKTNVEYIHPFVSIGVHEADKDRFDELYNVGARVFIIDVAHGHHILVKNMLNWIKTRLKEVILIAGNVATGEGAYDLVDWGADIVKVGIGPGSVCQTRQRTGVGVPQLYALEDVYNEFKIQGINANIIADGGITTVGDITKALKFADAVMIGSMIAGTSETPGNVFRSPDEQFYKIYGGSASAQNKGENKFVEGMMKTIPFKGKVKYILREIEDGIRSAFSYVGANNMKEYKEKCEFIFITEGSKQESKI